MPARAPKKLNSDFYVCKAIRLDRFRDFAELGIKTIINCRPDEPGLAFSSSEAEAVARGLGLHYVYVPIRDRLNITDREVRDFTRAFRTHPKPVVGYCRTGFRAAVAWALEELEHRDRAEIRAQVEAIGFDMEPVCHLIRARQRKIEAPRRSWFYRVFLQ